jgi:hypothetical protein
MRATTRDFERVKEFINMVATIVVRRQALDMLIDSELAMFF